MKEPFPRRPPRLTWLSQNISPFYFITFNTHQRRRILDSPAIHESFRLFAERAGDHAVTVGRYVIMPDHIHLFVFLPETGITLLAWIKALKVVLGKTLSGSGIKKPHWQEGFFDHVLRNGESYSLKWEYVRQNPVRAGLSPTPEDWPYQGEIHPVEFR